MRGFNVLLSSNGQTFCAFLPCALEQKTLPSEELFAFAEDVCGVPSVLQRLVLNGKTEVLPETILSLHDVCGHENQFGERSEHCVTLKVLLRLRGGKGGFGSLLRAQRHGQRKKTKNLDACRDIHGRRLRHAKVVERLKEWLQRKKEEDEIVKALTEGLADAGKGGKEAWRPDVRLEESYINEMKERASRMGSLVRAGMQAEKDRIEALSKALNRPTGFVIIPETGDKQGAPAAELKEKEGERGPPSKYKKTFFEETLGDSDSEEEDAAEGGAAGVAGKQAVAVFEDEQDEMVHAALEDDSEDENSEIDAYFDEKGEVDEQRISSFFEQEGGGGIDAERVKLFVQADVNSKKIDELQEKRQTRGQAKKKDASSSSSSSSSSSKDPQPAAAAAASAPASKGGKNTGSAGGVGAQGKRKR
uniref:SDE2-like domain-containing protein n=1 Tax=Chromera velia CCMP2878 TaxID=1169474 RepID=A0A0G4GP61_9ALVE|eukprot:Cvel_22759.t1-p1 / transcript=Cvel_22759.t1 / gene=Cvel_22759 / organism=Chromera_velia_CCMP2878 / gene_product=hypothetical protein / transcript_product=hypothetical protein / location=Cvel_scaffold2272:18212-21056(-) / protein_length=417 / sequence_SO=supercontig / SO=protein_coding / is_pseudo=false